MSKTVCKVTDCTWDTSGTEAGAGGCIGRAHPSCLLALCVSDRWMDDECGHEIDAALAVYAGLVDEEWRVTGDPGEDFPPYEFTWRGPDAEAQARGFARLAAGSWPDGPYLHHRTVTRTPWLAISPDPIPTTSNDQEK